MNLKPTLLTLNLLKMSIIRSTCNVMLIQLVIQTTEHLSISLRNFCTVSIQKRAVNGFLNIAEHCAASTRR